jgi:hypothetical protein
MVSFDIKLFEFAAKKSINPINQPTRPLIKASKQQRTNQTTSVKSHHDRITGAGGSLNDPAGRYWNTLITFPPILTR